MNQRSGRNLIMDNCSRGYKMEEPISYIPQGVSSWPDTVISAAWPSYTHTFKCAGVHSAVQGVPWFNMVQILNMCLQHLFSIQNELGPLPPCLPASTKKTLKIAVSADSTSEMLIYIRHGTSFLQSKSAGKWSKAESNKPSAQLCQISGLPDQRTACFGTFGQ